MSRLSLYIGTGLDKQKTRVLGPLHMLEKNIHFANIILCGDCEKLHLPIHLRYCNAK